MNKPDNLNHFCILPWIHLNINPNGSINPCCSTTDVYQIGNLNDMTLEKAWNSTQLTAIRKDILNNKLPDACKTCHKNEILGLESDRIRANNNNSNFFELIKNTLEDGTLPDYNLKSLDIRFSNHCNLSCRICRPISSTGWYTDAKLLGFKHINLDKKITPTPQNTKLLNETLPLLENLERLFFVGGEPLLQKEHFLFLDKLIEANNLKIRLDYVTNFTELKFGSKNVVPYWQKFKNVCIGISLDAVKERAEYLRKGLVWNSFLDNLKIIRNETPHVKIYILPTVSIHNIFHLPEFYNTLINELNFDADDILIKPLEQPSYYSAQVLRASQKNQVNQLFEDYIMNKTSKMSQKNRNIIHVQLHGILKFMKEADQSQKYPDFEEMTNRIDLLRSENFTSIFPEFKKT